MVLTTIRFFTHKQSQNHIFSDRHLSMLWSSICFRPHAREEEIYTLERQLGLSND